MESIYFQMTPRLEEYYDFVVKQSRWISAEEIPLLDTPKPYSNDPLGDLCEKPSFSDAALSLRPESKMLSLSSARRLLETLKSRSTPAESCSTDREEAPTSLRHVPLHELLRGSVLVPLRPAEKPVDPKLRETLERLRAEASNREYAAMMSKMGYIQHNKAVRDRAELKGASHSLGIGANILLTMATMFTLGYFILSYGMGGHIWGVAGGLCFMVVGLVVEGSLFMLGGFQLDDHSEKEDLRHKRSLGRSLAFPVEPLIKTGPRTFLEEPRRNRPAIPKQFLEAQKKKVQSTK